jgi:hypothetical protein
MSEQPPEIDERVAKSVAIRLLTAQAIATTDRIVVYLLDPVQDPGPLGSFPLHPYGPQRETGIHEVRTLEGAPAAHLLTLWAGLLRDDEGRQASCHYPIHGVRHRGLSPGPSPVREMNHAGPGPRPP